MKCPADLLRLLENYEHTATKEEMYIKRLLEDSVKQLERCGSDEYFYADGITRNFCRVIELMERRHAKEMAESKPELAQTTQYISEHNMELRRNAAQFHCGEDLMQAFYNYFKKPEQVDYFEIGLAYENGRKDLVNPTMKDYVARIYTFSGPKYLGEMFDSQQLAGKEPVLFTYENIELILATFKTRDESGEIVKQRVNIRSALRRLNEFKHAYRMD